MSEPFAIRRYKQAVQSQADRDEDERQRIVMAARTSWYEKANRQLPNPKDLDRAAEV